MQAQIKTLDLIKEEIPGWILAKQYGEDVLKVLEPIDKGWIEETKQRKEENRAKRAKQSAENKIRCEENACAARCQASDKQKATEQVFASQPLQPYTPHVALSGLAYPAYYPYPYYSIYPYAYSHSQTVLSHGASSLQSASYIPTPNTYPYPQYMRLSGSFTHQSSS